MMSDEETRDGGIGEDEEVAIPDEALDDEAPGDEEEAGPDEFGKDGDNPEEAWE